MTTQSLSLDGFKIIYTQDGEEYRFVIYDRSSSAILAASHGFGAAELIQATEENLRRTLSTWLRLTGRTKRQTDGEPRDGGKLG